MAEILPAYEGDVVAWAQEQARLLRARRFDALNIEHIAEEIEDVGKSEQPFQGVGSQRNRLILDCVTRSSHGFGHETGYGENFPH
jgi:hypothetical protein